MQSNLKSYIVKPLRRIYRYYLKQRVPLRKLQQKEVIDRIREKGECRVLFIASSLPMWRYHDVIQLLMADSRFKVNVALIPLKAFVLDDRRKSIDIMSKYFNGLGADYEIVDDYTALKREFKPDLIVYPQPYDENFDDVRADWRKNLDCLTMHTPYCLPITEAEWYYNTAFVNVAWKFFLPSEIHQKLSRRLSDNHGENTVVVGEPNADTFSIQAHADPWKQPADGKPRKRLIWAPHFSVVSYNMFDRPDFNWSHDIMRRIAEEYADRIQIVFKPHPRLKTELYKHPDWGKERTDEFYSFWENSPTTQLESGEYINLFKTSDAMIHNCGSFTAEYLYVGKPAAYLTRNLDGIKANMNDLGLECQDAHYTLTNEEEIRRFIDEVLLGDKDPLREKREKVFDDYLRVPYGNSVAENIYNDLVKSLFE